MILSNSSLLDSETILPSSSSFLFCLVNLLKSPCFEVPGFEGLGSEGLGFEGLGFESPDGPGT